MSENDDKFAQLWREAVEQHVTGMSDSDYAAFVARVRPPEPIDPVSLARSAAEQRQAGMATKAQQLMGLSTPNGYYGPRELSPLANIAAADVEEQTSANFEQ